MNGIELLLHQRQEQVAPKILDAPARNNQAEQTCTYEQVIKMIRTVLGNIMPDCKFVPHEDVRDLMQPDVKIETPIISFELIRRSPLKAQKPMFRNEVLEKVSESSEERIGTCYAWEMEYTIQFNIIASGYEKAQSVMNTFEEAILDYTGYFKKKGVRELLFMQQLKDSALEAFREHASVRNLQYYMILEKYWIDFESTLESVMIQNKK